MLPRFTNYNTPIFKKLGSHMKTTIEVSDVLFNSAKMLAQSSQTTLRALIEEGLRRVLADSHASKKPAFILQDASIKGGTMLIADPRQWHAMEEDHAIARTTQSLP